MIFNKAALKQYKKHYTNKNDKMLQNAKKSLIFGFSCKEIMEVKLHCNIDLIIYILYKFLILLFANKQHV